MLDDSSAALPAAVETDDDFDFGGHRRRALDAYQKVRRHYDDCAKAAESVLKAALDADGIRVHTLESRAKDPHSFARKASKPSDEDPTQPKYADPLKEITDLAAVRVITFDLDEINRVNAQIEKQFHVLEKTDKSRLLVEQNKLGYHSVHYIVGFTPERLTMPEYASYGTLVIEIQVRTILQHAWAEIEHDIQYKALETIPTAVRRRFTALAGLLEIADREFQAVIVEDTQVRAAALHDVEVGELSAVEVTQETLKAYLNRKFGADGRMSKDSYEWSARLVRRLGFSTLEDLDEAMSGFDDDLVSRVLHGSRQGQLSRMEDVLLASLGDEFIERHPWTHSDGDFDWRDGFGQRLSKLRAAGIASSQTNPLGS